MADGIDAGDRRSDRCPAISYQELLELDGDRAPDFLRMESPADIPLEPVAASRYTSADFLKLETAAVWHRSWQFACREDAIPQPGDCHLYEVAGKSAIIVRQADGSIKALQNACLHRGRKLVTEPGHKPQLKCPYHGFAWKIDGSLSCNPAPWDFPQVDESCFSLPELAVDSWEGFVFVNFDRDAPPLASVLHPLPEHFAGWNMADCYQAAHVGKIVPANWKAAVEAFIESFHVTCTHPQLTPYTGDANSQYDILSDHVCRFITPLGTPSPLIDSTSFTPEKLIDYWFANGSRAGNVDDENAPRPGEQPRAFAARLARRNWSEKTGRDLSGVSTAELIDAISYNFFPGFSVWGGVGSHIGYRWRPWEGRPDRCLMEVFLWVLPPAGEAKPAPASFNLLAEDQSWSDAKELGYLGGVYNQDQVNLRPVQEGMEAMGEDGVLTFSSYAESRCRNLHRMIDRYIAEYQARREARS
ncbi:MAG TPA: aromatic ring-hydroxylating dioxygenase subunit alpha [Novosphingobium sp.]|nr:aromatic ring-hydroxylating dioxygenase subunit alpha [Novosphingobium sp.]HMP55571.1 aromatic ring-hydroxylating dioxygenase subunit alpha [Novosphingobium sp.]